MNDAVTLLDAVLVGAALLTAIITVSVSARRAAVAGFLTLGVVMTIIWLRLGVVDVAFAEAALGTGVLTALLVWTASSTPRTAPVPHPRRWPRALLGVIAGMLLAVGIAGLWWRASDALPRWTEAVTEQTPQLGVTHEVTAVLLGFRAYDTLLETGVLFLAAVAVLALTDATGPGLLPARPRVPAPVARAARALAPAVFVLGAWLLFAGSSSPGGAFQSGAVFTALLVLLHVTGVDLSWLRRALPWALAGGVLVFSVAALPVFGAGEGWLGWAGPGALVLVLTVEIVLTVGITAGLFALYLGLEQSPRTHTAPRVSEVAR
ncbi:MAG: DUF4040 domain-containing protein [Micrococcus sp.]|nr:DUF4040 domain-containing protein [Micrococcus sp.]